MPLAPTPAIQQEGAGSPLFAATLAAAAMVAQQVVGKATRDSMFLSHFSAARLPLAMIAGATASAATVWLMTILIRRRGPARVVPVAFAAYSSALLLEWGASRRWDALIAAIVYVQTASVGGTVVSAFWSVVSEAFDPHTAKRVVGRIGAGAALGGVLGGGAAWGASALAGPRSMLVGMAALGMVAAWGARKLGASAPAPSRPGREGDVSGLSALGKTPYLRLLGTVVLVGALVQSLLDYTLGLGATAAYGTGARLLSFFAAFQTAVGLLSFLFQLTASRPALERLGIGGTIALVPAAVIASGSFALGIPSLLTVALQRGLTGALDASLFRSAYQVLFTPLPDSLKRPTKTVIDVGFDRLGTLLGSTLTLGLIGWGPHSPRVVTAAALVAAAAELVIAHRLHRGYVATLADRLRTGAIELDFANVVDRTTKKTLSMSLEGLDRAKLLMQIDALVAAQSTARPRTTPEGGPSDERLRVLLEIRSPDVETVRRALRSGPTPLAPHVFELFDLLARDDLAREAALALEPLVDGLLGCIVDVVLDERRPLSARRRAARLLRGVTSQRAADALVYALDAPELAVRYDCGRILLGMLERNPALRFDPEAAIARARRELESPDVAPGEPRALEHAFNVLSLTFPREPMQLAFGALQTRDPFLRGVAREYVDVVLPADLRASLAVHFKAQTVPPVAPPAARSSKQPLQELLESKEIIRLSLEQRRRLLDPETDG